MEAQQLAVVLALARAVLAAAEVQDHRVVALQLGQPVHVAVLVGQLEVGDASSGLESLLMVSCSLGDAGCRRSGRRWSAR